MVGHGYIVVVRALRVCSSHSGFVCVYWGWGREGDHKSGRITSISPLHYFLRVGRAATGLARLRRIPRLRHFLRIGRAHRSDRITPNFPITPLPEGGEGRHQDWPDYADFPDYATS